jgi:protocatechuate 4,5-dioxygenase, alpha chain
MCGSLCSPENRAAFQRDEEAYMTRFSLTESEKALIRRRDFAGMIAAGMNIYFMLKIGSVTGTSLYRMGAQMRGESYEDFLATRNLKDAV